MGNIQESQYQLYHPQESQENSKGRTAPRLHGSAPSKVVLNSAMKNAADPSKLHFRILTTEDDASELLEKVKDRRGVAEIWTGFFPLWVAPDKNGRVWIIPVCSSHSATRQYCWKIFTFCLVCNEWTILYNWVVLHWVVHALNIFCNTRIGYSSKSRIWFTGGPLS